MSGLTTTAAPAGQCRSRCVVLDLCPGALHELVALRSGDPTRLSRTSKTNGIGLSAKDHFLELIDAIGDVCCGGSRRNRSTRENRCYSELFGRLNDRTIWSTSR